MTGVVRAERDKSKSWYEQETKIIHQLWREENLLAESYLLFHVVRVDSCFRQGGPADVLVVHALD
jgi:hypothetical protein